jgi:phosphoribosylaminoimidazolesuccinocarboxamide synthase
MFEKIEQTGISTHYISANPDERTMTVKPVTVFGKGIEVICRLKATGSFIRRYGEYAKDGDILDYYVEVSLKDDEKGDPFISEELLEKFKILDKDEYKTLEKATKDITKIIQKTIEDKRLELIDIKLEFGRDKQGNIVLIDEISGGNMRVYKDGKSVKPIELSKILLDM